MKQLFPRIERWWHWFLPSFFRPRCTFCGWPYQVLLEDNRTMYPWDGKGDDPNCSVWLCRQCAAVYHQHWDEMWAEVHRYS